MGLNRPFPHSSRQLSSATQHPPALPIRKFLADPSDSADIFQIKVLEPYASFGLFYPRGDSSREVRVVWNDLAGGSGAAEGEVEVETVSKEEGEEEEEGDRRED